MARVGGPSLDNSQGNRRCLCPGCIAEGELNELNVSFRLQLHKDLSRTGGCG